MSFPMESSTHHDLCYSNHGDEKNRMGQPRRFDPTTQAPHSSAQTTELNSCINPNSKVTVSFCKDVRVLLGCRGPSHK